MLLWTAGALLLTALPSAVRSCCPGLLGDNNDGQDRLEEICFVTAYVRFLMIYLGVVLAPVTVALLFPGTLAPEHRFPWWRWGGSTALALWMPSFFVQVLYTNGLDHLVKVDEGIVSVQWGPLPNEAARAGCCLPWFEEYTGRDRLEWWCCDFSEYYYLWRIPGELRRHVLPSSYSADTLGFLYLPLWPLTAPIVGWSIVRWHRCRSPEAHDCCDSCGYNLTGNVSGICSECGTAIPPDKAPRTDVPSSAAQSPRSLSG